MITVQHYTTISAASWDDLVWKSSNGTIFHTLKFLSYHKNRFKDNEHHLIFKKDETILALLPLGFFQSENGHIAKSPYGASWGGIVFTKSIGVKYVDEITKALINYLKEHYIKQLIITLPPNCYDAHNDSIMDFTLLSNDFKIVNYELSHVLDIGGEVNDSFSLYDSKCRNQVRKGLQSFTITPFASVNEFYPILMEDKIRHSSHPTHSFEELQELNNKFPEQVFFSVATSTTGKKAGICYFAANSRCISTFYMSQENEALRLNGLNALVHEGITYAINKGFNYFDFGGSSVNGIIENFGVSQFKESFGAVGALRRKYCLNL